MAFQPFGYRFELKSPSQPSEVKAVIRSRKKQWFDRKNGARGWIIGPIICLWFSALDRNGPMLFGRIMRDGFGTRIVGRAGSDLNGLAMVCVLSLLLCWLYYGILADGNTTTEQIVIIACSAGLPLLMLWTSHLFRRDAEPLVRFLRDAVTAPGRTLRTKPSAPTISKAFSLEVSGDMVEGPVTFAAIHEALLGIGAEDFVILASAAETYIQTGLRDGDYFIEKRDGNAQRHFRALRLAAPSTGSSDAAFSFEEVREAFLAYASEAEMPMYIRWESMRL